MSLSQSHLTVFVLLRKFTAMAGISNSGSRNEYLAAGARLNLFSTNHSPIVKNSALASPTPRIPCQFSYHSIYVLLPWNEPPRVRILFCSTRDTESSQALPSLRTFPRRKKTLSTISPETDIRRSASLLSEMSSLSESPPSFLVFKGIEMSKRIVGSLDYEIADLGPELERKARDSVS